MPINPAALALPDAVQLLTKVGRKPVSEELLRQDIAAGAPTNRDGTLNIVHYAAWLARDLGRNTEERHGE